MMKMSVLRLALAAAVGMGVCGLAANAEEKGEASKVVVDIKLPKPAYVGTPKAIPPGTTAEKPTGKPRPPFMAPEGTKLISKDKPVTSSERDPIIGKLEMVTDGEKAGGDGNFVELGPGKQWVQIDLEKASSIVGIVIWHVHNDPRIYRDVIIQVSDDADFVTGVTTVFNNDQDNSYGLGAGKDREWFESYEGKLIEVSGAKGRYVRIHSQGSTSDDQNHYTEVEIYGMVK